MKKHLLKRVSAAILMLCILCLSGAWTSAAPLVPEDDMGYIRIHVDPIAEGAEMTLFEVGDYIDFHLVLNEKFRDCDTFLYAIDTADDLKEVATDLANYAIAQGYEGKTVTVNEDGNARFVNISTDMKLYLIMQTSGFDKVKVTPIFMRMPLFEETRYRYKVDIQAKYTDQTGKKKQSPIILNKTDTAGNPLAKAGFKLEQKVYIDNVPEGAERLQDEQGVYYWKLLTEDLVTSKCGQIFVNNLPFGVYRFTEIKAPAGYILDDTPHFVTVNCYGLAKFENQQYVAAEGEPAELTVINRSEDEPSPPPEESSKPDISIPDISYPEPSDVSHPSEPSEPSYPSYPSDPSYPSNPSQPSDISYPDISYPSQTDSDVTHPDISYPDISNPDSSIPDISYPDISYPDISYPDISNPDISEPDISYPDISYPDVSYPDISYPDVSNPDIVYPDISYPNVTPSNNDGKGPSIYTGDNVGKYVITSGVIVVSLASFILLFAFSNKKKKTSK